MSQPTALNFHRSMSRFLRSGIVPVICYGLLSVGGYTVIDIRYPHEDVYFTIAGLLDWAAIYLLFLALLKTSRVLPQALKAGVGTYFVMQFATGFAILVGTLLLILPGLYLAMRWLPSFARAFATGDGVGDSLAWSWEKTGPIQKQLSLAMVGPTLALLVGTMALLHYNFVYLVDDGWERSLGYEVVNSLVVNFSFFVATVWFTLLGLATFELLQRTESENPT